MRGDPHPTIFLREDRERTVVVDLTKPHQKKARILAERFRRGLVQNITCFHVVFPDSIFQCLVLSRKVGIFLLFKQ